MVPLFSSSTDWWFLPLCYRDWYAQCQTVLLDWLLTCPLLCNARCEVHARHGRRHPCRGAEAVSFGPVQQTTEIHQLHSINQVFDVPVAQDQLFTGAGREKLVEIPQLHSSHSCLDKVVHTPVVCNGRCPDGSDAVCRCYAGAVPVVMDIPETMLRRFLLNSGSAADSAHRLVWWTSQFATERQVAFRSWVR